MRSPSGKSLTATLARACSIAAVAALVLAAQAQPTGIDPEAQRLLKASTDFLASQQRFSVESRNTLEVVLTSGQKIQFGHAARMPGSTGPARQSSSRAALSLEYHDPMVFVRPPQPIERK